MRLKVILSAAVLAATTVAGAGVTASTTAGAATNAATAAAVSATAPCAGSAAGVAPTTWDHVVLIMFENKPLKKIIGNTTDAPYLNSLAKACSYSKNTLSLSPTSLANYVALTSGYTGCKTADSNGVCTQPLEITANDDPSVWPQASKSFFEVMDAAAPGSALQWAESMPTNCALKSARSSDFTVTHTPFQYYTRTQKTYCPQYARPFPASSLDVMSGKFNLIIPNKKDIMHLVPNTTVAQRIRNGDNWLKGYLPPLLNSDTYQAGRTAILITWDEGNAKNFLVPLIVLTPHTAAGGVSSVPYDHYSTLKGLQQMVGAGPLLGHAGDAGKTSIRDDALFGLKP